MSDEHFDNSYQNYQNFFAKSWAAISFRFQWKKGNEGDFFGPGFNLTSPDQIS